MGRTGGIRQAGNARHVGRTGNAGNNTGNSAAAHAAARCVGGTYLRALPADDVAAGTWRRPSDMPISTPLTSAA